MNLKRTALIAGGAAGLAGAAVTCGNRRWRRRTDALWRQIQARRSAPAPATFRSQELADLPPPVQRYFGAVLEEGQPKIASARIAHVGTFNLDASGERWVSFRSSQRSVARRPGFVWTARMSLPPGLPVLVQDGYVAGRGVLEARALGLVTVMRQPETRELAEGELMRFLAEAVWMPTALLPSEGVRWEPVDERSARATLTDGDLSVSLLFEFGERGLIRGVRSSGRPRAVDGEAVPTPWEGQFWDYERRQGILVPLAGEVAWILPDGRIPYWRGTMEEIAFDFAG